VTADIKTVAITLHKPASPGDAGEAAYIHFTHVDGVLRVVDPAGAQMRFANGEPLMRRLGPEDSPRVVAAQMGRQYHEETYGNREKGFWRELPAGGGGSPV
jgi:hypothetical protein